MDILLKERMVLYGPHRSDTVYVRGIHKSTTADEVVRLVSLVAEPLEVDLSQRSASGEIWVKYKNLADTQQAILVLHQRIEKGVYIPRDMNLGKQQMESMFPTLVLIIQEFVMCLHLILGPH